MYRQEKYSSAFFHNEKNIYDTINEEILVIPEFLVIKAIFSTFILVLKIKGKMTV